VKANPRMEALYDEIQEEHLDDPKALPQKLIKLLDEGFVEEDGCVFLARLKKDAPVQRLDFADQTAYESFVNHVHLEDFLENGGLPPLELLGRGIAFARELLRRLSRLHGTKEFRVIVASDGQSSTVRFHTIRPDEHWVSKGLEEALAIVETKELLP
jgi:hypothetical protein